MRTLMTNNNNEQMIYEQKFKSNGDFWAVAISTGRLLQDKYLVEPEQACSMINSFVETGLKKVELI